MERFRRFGLTLLALLLFGCLPATAPISDPNPAGVGFGEDLFKLQGRVDYIYGHVLRNQKKLELQVGNLRRTVQDLERGSENGRCMSNIVASLLR